MNGNLTETTAEFSVRMPAWVNPKEWVRWLGDRIASGIAGRTTPQTCGAAPSWATLNVKAVTVHGCASTNTDKSGAKRAEADFKSNRGTFLQISVAAGADYVWVEGQPWPVRRAVMGGLGLDPNQTVFLPPGARVTAGYRQPATDETKRFSVSTTPVTIGLGVTYQAIDALVGGTVDQAGVVIATLYLVQKCR